MREIYKKFYANQKSKRQKYMSACNYNVNAKNVENLVFIGHMNK